MKRSGYIPRKTPLRSVNRKRKASTFARCFHSSARVRFVKRLRCCVCPGWPTVNAHVKIGGTGYREDYRFIVPLCESCHDSQEGRTAAFEAERGLAPGSLLAAAAETQAAWEAFSSQ